MALSQVRKPIEQYPIDPDAFILSNMMDRVLERLVAVYEQQGVPLPLRRYWMMGAEVPEDCEQAVVTYLQSYLGLPGDQASNAQNCNTSRTAVLNIVITRDYPIGEVGKAVSPDAIIAASKWSAVDTAVLLWGLQDFAAIDGMPGPQVIATVNTMPPNGGVQSTVLNISMMVA
ncbi:hypothetical protein SEA_BIG4_82 [Microbacterium phage Big4]|nr:hypothetical protein SEA_BIG4_82 [Microbacterium phage Big4]